MNLLDILSGTPFWVYVIFIYLLIIGIKSLKSSEISLLWLLLVPTIFISWSLSSLSAKYTLALPTLSLWVVALAAGSLIGRLLFYQGVRVNKKTMSVYVTGSMYPLILYMSFFILKYWINASYALLPAADISPLFWAIDVIASGLISGIFLGRLLHVVHQYQQS